jgi:tetratricopeptide (TPR) repeat protein
MTKAKQKFDSAMAQFVGQRYDKSIHLFSEAITFDPEFKLAFMSRGAAHLRLGQTQEALADFNHVLEMDPNNARAFHLRGLAHEKIGEYVKAVADLSKAIEINPEYGAAYYSRANLYSKIDDKDHAAEDIKMVTHLTEVNIESFGDENNVWRTRHLHLESLSNDDLAMER